MLAAALSLLALKHHQHQPSIELDPVQERGDASNRSQLGLKWSGFQFPSGIHSLHMARVAFPDTKLFITECGLAPHLSTDLTSKME